MCEYYYLYTLSSPLSEYVEFRTRMHVDTYKMNVTVRIDIIYDEYYLYNRKPLDIFNLSLNKSYYLFLEFFETADISFIIDNTTQKPFSEIYIHEFGKRKNPRKIIVINKPISFIENNSELIASFSYIANSNYTKYIALQIKPYFNISHIIAKYEYSLTTFDLYNDIWKTIDNLIRNQIYLFFIEVRNPPK